MKKISLFLTSIIQVLVIPILAIESITVFAAENLPGQIQTTAQPQVTSQTATPNALQETIAACSGLYEKDSCQFHNNNTLMNGTCKILPSGNNNYELSCQAEKSTKNAAADSDKDASEGHSKEPHQHKHKRS